MEYAHMHTLWSWWSVSCDVCVCLCLVSLCLIDTSVHRRAPCAQLLLVRSTGGTNWLPWEKLHLLRWQGGGTSSLCVWDVMSPIKEFSHHPRALFIALHWFWAKVPNGRMLIWHEKTRGALFLCLGVCVCLSNRQWGFPFCFTFFLCRPPSIGKVQLHCLQCLLWKNIWTVQRMFVFQTIKGGWWKEVSFQVGSMRMRL